MKQSVKSPPVSLFPTRAPELAWSEFAAAGFDTAVSGVIYRTGKPPCCGVPVGGLATGCVDIDARGIYGFSTLFNPMSFPPHHIMHRIPRKLPRVRAVLGLSVGGKTWVMATRQVLDGGEIDWCTEPYGNDGSGKIKPIRLSGPRVENVECAREIHYWGHYPVADLEYETDAPVGVGMRVWAPFVPGDAAVSNMPGAVFEVHLRNGTSEAQAGAVAMNFPGPDAEEARAGEFLRQEVKEDVRGVQVRPGGIGYFLGVIGEEVRTGGGLHGSGKAWSRMGEELPRPRYREEGGRRWYPEGESSAAVDFTLGAGEEKVVRFVLSWYAPEREAQTRTWPERPDEDSGPGMKTRWIGSPWEGETHYYTHMYASRYGSALDVARRLAAEHEELLSRVLGWQSAIYGDQSLPAWLRDSLVNNLCLIAEDACWAQARPPLGDWAFPDGAFGLIESPRACPTMACIPCDWYGNLPIVFFFPELARSTLRAFKHYQKLDGEIPFALGRIDLPDFAVPGYFWQVSLNGFCFIDMVDRLWQTTGDDSVLREFYDAAKRGNTYAMSISRDPAAAIRMPDIGGMEWFEWGEWAGWTTHAGGLRLAGLKILERMAQAMGDDAYAERCRKWFADGSKALEEHMWTGSYYLNFYEPETGKKSDDVMCYQLDGEWVARYHGLPGIFREDRIGTVLETIKRCNIALTAEIGAANFARPEGTPLSAESKIAYYGVFAMFTSELLLLACTYMYAGQKEFGLELARKYWTNLVLKQRHTWDLPNMVEGQTGKRHFGTDYYQNMMLWVLPTVISDASIVDTRSRESLAQRVLAAGRLSDRT